MVELQLHIICEKYYVTFTKPQIENKNLDLKIIQFTQYMYHTLYLQIEVEHNFFVLYTFVSFGFFLPFSFSDCNCSCNFVFYSFFFHKYVLSWQRISISRMQKKSLFIIQNERSKIIKFYITFSISIPFFTCA